MNTTMAITISLRSLVIIFFATPPRFICILRTYIIGSENINKKN